MKALPSPARVVIFGATSAMAQGAARAFADDGASLFLVGRDEGRTEAVAADLRVKGAGTVVSRAMDFDAFDTFGATLEAARSTLGGYDVVLIAHGMLGDQAEAERDFSTAEQILRVNFLSVVALCTEAANTLEAQGHGTICVISSVAGDRGRQSNYIYGTAKGAVNIFLQGLRNRLHEKNVHVCCIKPGFVKSPMTAHLKQGPLFAEADKIGRGIVQAIRSRKDEVYLPKFWAAIMGGIRAVPEPVFKRMKL